MFKLLIVDDERIIREGLKNVVHWETLGFSVVSMKGNGQEALEYMSQHQIDAVLADIRMPKMSGLEFCRKVARIYPDVRIIILSGYDHFEYAQDAIHSGIVFHYLLKPVREAEIQEVFTRLADYLSLKQKNDRKTARLQKLEASDLFQKLIKNIAVIDIDRFKKILGITVELSMNLLRISPLNSGLNYEQQVEFTNTILSSGTSYKNIISAKDDRGSIFLIGTSREKIQGQEDLLILIKDTLKKDLPGITILISKSFTTVEALPQAIGQISSMMKQEIFFYPDKINPVNITSDGKEKTENQIMVVIEKIAQAIVHKPEVEQRERICEEIKFVRKNFPPTKEVLLQIFRGVLQQVESLLATMAFSGLWIDKILEVCNTGKSDNYYLYDIENYFFLLGDNLRKAMNEVESSVSGALVNRAIRILLKEFSEGIGLEQLAFRLSISSVHLSRILKRKEG